jgi:hypothetical protein
MQGPDNVILTTLKNKTIGYEQYLGAKGGFTLVLGGYQFGQLECWFQLPGTKLEPGLIFGKFKTGPGSGLKTGTQTWF